MVAKAINVIKVMIIILGETVLGFYYLHLSWDWGQEKGYSAGEGGDD